MLRMLFSSTGGKAGALDSGAAVGAGASVGTSVAAGAEQAAQLARECQRRAIGEARLAQQDRLQSGFACGLRAAEQLAQLSFAAVDELAGRQREEARRQRALHPSSSSTR